MNFDPDPKRIGNAIASVLTWLLAFAAVIFAAYTASIGPVVWFVVGYVARRLVPQPAAPGGRAIAMFLLALACVVTSAVTRSWGPVLWFIAGWAAFATTYNPPES